MMMSNRSLVELNHDYCPPHDDTKLLAWAKAMQSYMRNADVRELPPGVVRKHYRAPQVAVPNAIPSLMDPIDF
jgi:hypothetical protein